MSKKYILKDEKERDVALKIPEVERIELEDSKSAFNNVYESTLVNFKRALTPKDGDLEDFRRVGALAGLLNRFIVAVMSAQENAMDWSIQMKRDIVKGDSIQARFITQDQIDMPQSGHLLGKSTRSFKF